MVDAGLRPTDPVRWWLAYRHARAAADGQDTAGGGGRGEQDIKVLGDADAAHNGG